MKKIYTLLFTLLFSSAFLVFGQIPTSLGFNYYNINSEAFETTSSNFDTYFSNYSINERAYWATSLTLALASEKLYKAPQTAIQPDTIVGAYRLVRRNYFNQTVGGETIKMIILRPNDTIVRPTILITHGGELSGGDAFRQMSLGVTDFVQRGYVVVYYQSGVDNAVNFQAALQAGGISSPCSQAFYAPMDQACLEQRVLLKMQFGYAAAQFTVAQKDTFYMDANNLFLVGFSGGALGSFHLALADQVSNYQDSIFAPIGNFNRYAIDSLASFDIKAVATLGGALIHDPIAGPLVGPEDSAMRVIMFHGQDDAAGKSDAGKLFWGLPLGNPLSVDCEMRGSVSLKDTFSNYNIESKTILNCSGCHEVFSYPCTYCDDCDGNLVLYSGLECYDWRNQNLRTVMQNPASVIFNKPMRLAYYMMQIHDIGMLTAKFFHKDFADNQHPESPSSLVDDILQDNETAAVNPLDYPYFNASPNGHFSRSTKCLVQQNSALFFNRFGDNGEVFTAANPDGDYLNIPWASQGQGDVLGSDFTLEIRFKTKNHQGRGTLISYLDKIGVGRGMELFIKSDGTLNFQYRNTFQLTDTTDINDEKCHHVAITRTGNDYRLWLDGVMKSELLNQGASNYDLPDSIRIGNSLQTPGIGNNFAYNGIISEFRIWSRAISNCAELNDVNVTSNATGLVAKWKFDEGEVQRLNSTANGNSIDLVLGESSSTLAFDPKWLENDELCDCDVATFGLDDASFQASEDTVCDRTFAFSSTQASGTHIWDFGDGSSASIPNPTHNFPTFGTFQVTHSIIGTCGPSQDLRTFLIDSDFAAQFGLNPTSFNQNDTIQWTYQGGQYGDFIIDGTPDGSFDIWALPPTFSLNNGNTQGIVLPSGLVIQNTVMNNLSPGMHEICFATFNSGTSCTDTICINVTVGMATTNPEEYLNDAEIRIFPNPASDKINFAFTGNDKGATDIFLYSLDGSVQQNHSVNATPGQPIKPIDISQLPSGIYFVTIRSPKGKLYCKKIVKI